MGYSLASSVVKASDYGVPQNRERFFLLGVHKSVEADEIFIPESTWSRERIEKELTISNVIDDLNSYKEWGGYGTGEIWGPSTYTKPAKSKFAKSMRAHSDAINSTWNTKIPRHTKLVSERMRRILKGETPDDWIGTELETKKHSQRGLRKDKFEQITMVSTPDDYVHYDIELPRTLSVRECARFQTFPGSSCSTGKERQVENEGRSMCHSIHRLRMHNSSTTSGDILLFIFRNSSNNKLTKSNFLGIFSQIVQLDGLFGLGYDWNSNLPR